MLLTSPKRFSISWKFIFNDRNSFHTLFAYGNAQRWLIWRLKATFDNRHIYPTTYVFQSSFVLSVSNFLVLQVFVLTILTILICWDWFIFCLTTLFIKSTYCSFEKRTLFLFYHILCFILLCFDLLCVNYYLMGV